MRKILEWFVCLISRWSWTRPLKKILPVLLLVGVGFAQVPGSSQYGNQFPDAPEPVKRLPHGAWMHDAAGDPPKQKTFTKKFVAAHAVFLGSIVFDVEMTQHCEAKGTCIEGGSDVPRGGAYESRGEMYRNDLIPFAVMTGFDILVQHAHFPKKAGWLAYIGSTYGTAVHLKGGFQGLKYR
jgi:hypothetical protein